MNFDRDQLAQTMRSVALPALAGAAGTGALGAYMSSQSDHPGELPSQRRRRILRNALVSAGLGGMAGAALPAGLKMLSEPYIGSGATGGPGVLDKAVSAGLGHALPLAALGGAGVFAHRRMQSNESDAMQHIFDALGKKEPLPPGLAAEVGMPNLQNEARVKQLFTKGDRATKFLLNRLSSGPADAEGLNRLFSSADLLRTAGHPGVSLNDLKRMYQPEGHVPLEDFPISFHRTPQEVNWPEAYSKYLSTSNNPIDWMLGKGVGGKVNLGPLGERAMPSGLSRVAQLLAERSRPGSARMLGRFGGPLGKGLLGAGGLLGLYLANKGQQTLQGN